ncbi:MAG: flavin reductase [Prevotella sp.]|jgi:flavin reductase (DIM6/NTAB) family NADH-FMN oxidoreductase RutF|uniref:Flavin reductase n=1 Tax=Segatella cerevisiae TaxID=2053716 RepID=A0ABT1BZK6_9BACT|nr:flavin reductase [Segatella cerevisiae]MCH3995796.1 flavin reductase [Prevotella sp.]MCI1245775.1 flavin reductase [Prevotella sp.]MCO6025653.1 flavin reductase [Segatella cerevisiae]
MKKLLLVFGILSVCLLTTSFTEPGKEGSTTPSSQSDLQGDKGVFKKINPKDLKDNPISLFANNWFVLSAGDSSKYNEMTISWGNLGNVWGQPTVTVYILSTRYTYSFIDKGKYFVLNAFDEPYRKKVRFIGTHSGRDIDKVKETGLTTKFTALGNPYFAEARLVIECEKIYYDDIHPAQLSIGNKNPNGNAVPRRMFIGKIVNMWEKE